MVWVIAKRMGFYNHLRQREGSRFAMRPTDFIPKEKILNQEGKVFFSHGGQDYMLPTWVELADLDDKPRKGKAKNQQPIIESDDVI